MRRRRSCLSVPASSARKLEKAVTLRVDEVVVDLEDGVLPAAKDEAREAAVRALPGWGERLAAVRVNAPRSRWCRHDIEAVASLGTGPASIVVPKVEAAGDLAFVDRLLDGIEAERPRSRPLAVQALIESAAGLANLAEIAAASRRLEALILGYADLEASLGGGREAAEWLPAQQALVVAARRAGVQVIDGPHVGIEVDDEFLAGVRRARRLGFDGKWVIHPAQLDAVEQEFTPSSAEVERAERVVAAMEAADQGAIAVDGEMLDEAVVAIARNVLARAAGAKD